MIEALRIRSVLGLVVCVLSAAFVQLASASHATTLTQDAHQYHQHHRGGPPVPPSPVPSGPTSLVGAFDLGLPTPSYTSTLSAARQEEQVSGSDIPPVTEQPQSSPAPRVTSSRPPVNAGLRRAMRVLPFGLGLALVGFGIAAIGLGLRRS